MGIYTKFIVAALGGALVLFPMMATRSGWGLESERNAKVVKQLKKMSCPSYQRDVFGKCKRSHRSYFGGRSVMGGGPGFGK